MPISPGVSVLFAVSGWMFLARPWESPIDRAYRLCGECGLPSSEVDWLIGVMRDNPKTRAEKLEDFRKLFNDSLDLEFCEPCAEGVLDAATTGSIPVEVYRVGHCVGRHVALTQNRLPSDFSATCNSCCRPRNAA